MVTIKSLTDLIMVFGSNAQEALDFISNESNQQKFQRYLGFKAEPDVAANILVHNDRTDKETKIRIALDGGKFLTKEEWNAGQYSKDDVIGIAVITPCVQFILGLKEWEACWSEDTDNCITGKHNESQALQITCGYEDTKRIVEAQKNEEDTAAKLCWNYGHKGLQWYLPCVLELVAACAHKEEINELLELVGGDPLSLSGHWSSTECNSNLSWGVNFDDGGVYGYNYGKYGTSVVRPAVAYHP